MEIAKSRFFNDTSLVNYYQFEGNSNDSKGNSNGSDVNTVKHSNYGKYGLGVFLDKSLSSDPYILAGTNRAQSSAFSVCMWARMPTAPASNATLWSQRGTNTWNFNVLLFIGTDSLLKCYIYKWAETIDILQSTGTVSAGVWHHFAFVNGTTFAAIYLDGVQVDYSVYPFSGAYAPSQWSPTIGSTTPGNDTWDGNIDDVAVFTRALTASEIKEIYADDKNRYIAGIDGDAGTYPSADNSSLDTSLIAWKRLQPLLRKSVNGGQCFKEGIVSTYPLVYTASGAYFGGVLAPNGDIHFTPYAATVGQKISTITGIVSTYTILTNYLRGACLDSNGNIHQIGYGTTHQKIDKTGIVSTYTSITGGYIGAILSSSGEVHFCPYEGSVGQKVSSAGVVSTYSLVYTVQYAYWGGCLAPNGDIHFCPIAYATVGQKVSSSGIVSTYSLIVTGNTNWMGMVLSPKGDIHFIPRNSSVGQKIDITGNVSTYSNQYIDNSTWFGCLAPNGDIHRSPYASNVGVKISKESVVSTYSLVYTNSSGAYVGGVLAPNGDIYFIPYEASVGQKISTLPGIPFSQNLCLSPFFNKL